MKVSELTGAALDWAVTKAEGFDSEVTSPEWGLWRWATDWGQGGPIIERERIAIWGDNPYWEAEFSDSYGLTWAKGPTPLVAAMRCYVSSKVGEEIEVPDELLQGEEA